MRARTIQILLAVTLLVAVAAALALRNREARTAPTAAVGEHLFPELRARVNDVAAIKIQGKDSTFTLRREADAWGAADKSGYPIAIDKVKELVVGISQFDVVERMTADPERYAKLGVQDPKTPDAEAKQVTLEDKSGAVLADVIVGKPHSSRGAGGKPTLYARKVGDSQAFEVTGRLTVDDQITNWLDKQIAKLDKKRVRRVVVHQPDGTELALSKDTAEAENFAVENLPEGAELSWPGVANGVAGALEWLNLEDVKPAAEVDLTGEVTTTTFTTFDGLVITALTQEKDDKTYLKLTAAYDESARVEPAAPIGPAEPEATAEGDTAAAPKDEAKPAGKTPDEVKKEVETLNTRLVAWAYVIPGYGAANLRKKLEDLLKKPAAPEAAEGESPFGTDETTLPIEGETPIVPPASDGATPPTPPAPEDPKPTPPETPPESKPPQGGGGR